MRAQSKVKTRKPLKNSPPQEVNQEVLAHGNSINFTARAFRTSRADKLQISRNAIEELAK